MAYCQPFSCMPSIVADKSHCGKRMSEREGENVFTWIDFGNSLSFIIVLLLCESDMIQMFVFSKKNGKLNGFRKQKPKSYGLQFSSICENARFGVRFFFPAPPPLLDWKKRCFYYRMQAVDQIRDCSLCPPLLRP